MKGKKKFIIITIIVIVVLSVAVAAVCAFLHNGKTNSPENAVKEFHNSLLPDYNAENLEKSVGTEVYDIRFDDGGYFVDRYERTRKQIVYYYGEDFSSTLSDFIISDIGDTEKTVITKDYLSKYSLEIDEAKRVTFSVTLSSEVGEKSRTQSLIVLKINGEWLIYDYDAYWFAYM